MIKTKKDLKEYLAVEYYDFINMGNRLKNQVLPPPNYLYIKVLRKYEYYLTLVFLQNVQNTKTYRNNYPMQHLRQRSYIVSFW